LCEAAREDVEEQPAEVGKEILVMTKEDAYHLGKRL
jgi:hypothetical protein